MGLYTKTYHKKKKRSAGKRWRSRGSLVNPAALITLLVSAVPHSCARCHGGGGLRGMGTWHLLVLFAQLLVRQESFQNKMFMRRRKSIPGLLMHLLVYSGAPGVAATRPLVWLQCRHWESKEASKGQAQQVSTECLFGDTLFPAPQV